MAAERPSDLRGQQCHLALQTHLVTAPCELLPRHSRLGGVESLLGRGIRTRDKARSGDGDCGG